MSRFVMTAVAHLIGNAAGLLLAAVLLDGFHIEFMAFLLVVVIFTGVEVVAQPLLTRVSEKSLPSLMGGIALVTTFVGLLVTGGLVSGFQIGGLANLLAATLLVWLGALIAGILLSAFVFKGLRDTPAD